MNYATSFLVCTHNKKTFPIKNTLLLCKKRVFCKYVALPFIFTLLFISYGFTSFVTAKGTSTSTFAHKQPLSTESQILYYYLVLYEATENNDIETMAFAMQQLLELNPPKELYHDIGTVLLNAQNFTDLITVAAKGIKRYPDDRLLALFLSTGYSETGDIGKAMTTLESHIKTTTPAIINNNDIPDYDSTIKELVRLYTIDGDMRRAISFLPILTGEKAPKNIVLRARILTLVAKYKEAETELLLLSRKNPENADIWLELGSLAENQNKIKEAIEYYQKSYALSPSNTDVLFRLLGLYIASDNAGEIVALSNNKNIPSSILLQIALFLSEKGYAKEAFLLVDRAKKLKGHPDEIAIATAGVYINSGADKAKAFEALNTIKKTSVYYEETLERLIRLYLWDGNPEKAFELATQACELFKTNVQFHSLLAQTLAEMNQYDEAKKSLRAALISFNGNSALRYTLGLIEDQEGNKKAALATMEQLIIDNPRHAEALNYIGYSLAEKNTNLKRALSLLLRAYNEQPNSWYILDSLAWVHYRIGNYNEAWKYIQQCVSLGAKESIVWEHYGDIALKIKMKDEARKGYTEALKFNPENIPELQKKLRSLQP